MERLARNLLSSFGALGLLFGLACAGGASPQASSGSVDRSSAVSVSPDVNRITMTELHNRQFKAVVNGTSNQAVTWRVVEPDGGTIDAVGNYTAPEKEGTYHIVVSSAVNPTVNSTIETTVVPPATIGTFAASKGYTPSGGAVTLTASWSGGTASIDHGVGALATSPATPIVNPTASTVYNLTVLNSAGDPTVQSVFVKVDGTISVYVTPTAVRLGIRQSYAFVAVVTGATDNRVTWSVEEGAAGGTINYAGAYTAPANAAGVFHVRATSVEDPTKYSRSTVTVTYGWSAPSILDQGLGSTGQVAKVAGDPTSGNAFAVWMEKDPTSGHTVPWAAKFTASTGTWGGFQAISDGFADGTSDSGGGTWAPEIAVDGSGNAMAVWMQTTAAASSRNDLFAAYYQAGAGWKTRVRISDGLNNVAVYPKVVMDGSGNAIAVWPESDGTHNHLWANRFTGGAWGSAAQLETNANGDAMPPSLAGDAAGDAVATWAQSDGTAVSAYGISYTAGSGWGAPALIETSPNVVYSFSYSNTVRVAMDSSGNAVTVFAQKSGTYYQVTVATRPAGGSWSPVMGIGAAGGDLLFPNIAMDASGNYLLAYFNGTTINTYRSKDSAYGTANPGAAAWSLVSYGEPVSLALDASGDAVICWVDSSDSTAWVNSFLADGSWRTPLHLQDPGTSPSSGLFWGAFNAVFQDAQGRALLFYPAVPGPQTQIVWSRLQ